MPQFRIQHSAFSICGKHSAIKEKSPNGKGVRGAIIAHVSTPKKGAKSGCKFLSAGYKVHPQSLWWQVRKLSKFSFNFASFLFSAVTNLSYSLIKSTSRPKKCNNLHIFIFIFTYLSQKIFFTERRCKAVALCKQKRARGNALSAVAQLVYHLFFLCQ